MGLVILAALALYFLISISVAVGAAFYANHRGRSGWRWGMAAALVMYLIPFWDWVPTVAMHRYYCATEAGFWVYKSVDQWKVEHSGVILTQGGATSIQQEEHGHKEIHQVNQRLSWIIKLHQTSSILKVSEREEVLVDTTTNGVLARFVDFSRGDQRSTGTAKFWLVKSDCNDGENYRVRMGKIVDKAYAELRGANK